MLPAATTPIPINAAKVADAIPIRFDVFIAFSKIRQAEEIRTNHSRFQVISQPQNVPKSPSEDRNEN
jgi:hypothetical protein